MKKRRLGKMFILYIVTLGIYRLYWLAKTRKEMLTNQPKQKILPVAVLLLPYLLLVIGAIGLVVGIYRDEARLDQADCRASSSASAQYDYRSDYTVDSSSEYRDTSCDPDVSIVYVGLFYLACVAFLPLLAWWMWGYSKAVEAVTEDKLSFPITLIILLLVPDGIDMLLIQESFNKVAASPAKQAA